MILKNPSIILLDEATSALDRESEKQVEESLKSLIKGRTSISIAHRLDTIIDSDVIFVMEDGRIVEQGVHQELLDKKGKYIKHKEEEEPKEPETKICPYCLTEVKYHATRCPHCTSELTEEVSKQ